MYLANMKLPDSSHLLLYMESRRSQPHGSLALLHAGPVELLYYWFYRAPHDSTTTSSTLATILTTTLSSAELITCTSILNRYFLLYINTYQFSNYFNLAAVVHPFAEHIT